MANYNSGPIAVSLPAGSPGTGAQVKPEPKLSKSGSRSGKAWPRRAIFGLGNMFEVAEEAAKKLEEKGI